MEMYDLVQDYIYSSLHRIIINKILKKKTWTEFFCINISFVAPGYWLHCVQDIERMYLHTYCTVLYCTVLYCTVLYCTVLYCTVLYCTVLYCTVCMNKENKRPFYSAAIIDQRCLKFRGQNKLTCLEHAL